jgi:hypothetical protein
MLAGVCKISPPVQLLHILLRKTICMIGENALFIHVHVHDLLSTLLIFDALDLMASVNNTQVDRDQPRVKTKCGGSLLSIFRQSKLWFKGSSKGDHAQTTSLVISGYPRTKNLKIYPLWMEIALREWAEAGTAL